MRDIEALDLESHGAWRRAAVHDGSGGSGWSEERCRLEAEAFVLETKSGDPQAALSALLDDMTAEMRAQFELFRKLRAAAEVLDGGGDDAAAKLARADIKAATDGMSQIIRTLEKIDALQRQTARDRELESERNAEATGYDDAKQRLLAIIEQRVAERVDAILAGGEAAMSAAREAAADLPPCGGDVTAGDGGG